LENAAERVVLCNVVLTPLCDTIYDMSPEAGIGGGALEVARFLEFAILKGSAEKGSPDWFLTPYYEETGERKPARLTAIAAEHGWTITPPQVQEWIGWSTTTPNNELTEDELELVSGGATKSSQGQCGTTTCVACCNSGSRCATCVCPTTCA
jgi:hypothetical protein